MNLGSAPACRPQTRTLAEGGGFRGRGWGPQIGANASSMISCCSTACTFDDPDDGADRASARQGGGVRANREVALFSHIFNKAREFPAE